MLKFPDNFLWGAATSSHQVEGGNFNDWSVWEHANSARLAAEAASRHAKAPMRIPKYILNKYPNPLQEENYISGRACDHYNRFREDFDIAKSLGHNAHRFSIEWSRIEPEEGKFDEKEIEHYRDVIKALHERGIEPMVTLWHFTNPIWFAKIGGFTNKKSPEYFARYVKYVADCLKNEVGLWITFNEPVNMYGYLAYLKGYWPPQLKNIFNFLKLKRNFIKAHILAYRGIKNCYPQGTKPLVGVVETTTYILSGILLKPIGKIFNKLRNFQFWNKTLPYQDFIGLNYYTSRRLPGSFKEAPRGDTQELMNWEIYPKGIYHILLGLKKFKKPIFITENGIADATDQKREKFIKGHLFWIHKAIAGGVDVGGYFYWSFLDNFEWAHGFAPRFGLVEVDYSAKGPLRPRSEASGFASGGKTLERKIRPSALKYAEICRKNSLIL